LNSIIDRRRGREGREREKESYETVEEGGKEKSPSLPEDLRERKRKKLKKKRGQWLLSQGEKGVNWSSVAAVGGKMTEEEKKRENIHSPNPFHPVKKKKGGDETSHFIPDWGKKHVSEGGGEKGKRNYLPPLFPAGERKKRGSRP